MCQTVLCFTAFILALLTSQCIRDALLIQAVSTSAPLQRGQALSSYESTSVSRAAPVEKHDAIAFISGVPAKGKEARYEDIVARMKARQAERQRREQAWQQEKAASGIVQRTPERPSRFDPSHPLYKEYAMERMRQRAGRLRTAPRASREEKEEDTTAIYKNTIRACVLGEDIDRIEFCEKTGFAAECEEILDKFERTNKFNKLKFKPLTYNVTVNGDDFIASVPLFDIAVLRFLAQLHYTLSETCNYEVGASQLVLIFFEDGIDSTLAGEQAWRLSRAPQGGKMGKAIGALQHAISFHIPHYSQLHQMAVKLTTLLVRAGNTRSTSPLLARFINFACRSARLCRSIIGELVESAAGPFRNSAAGSPTKSLALLTHELREALTALFDGNLQRIAKNGAVVLGRWLTQSTRTILESASGLEEDIEED